MAGASINFQKASSHAFAHNDRSSKVSYLIDDPKENECNRSASKAKSLLDQFVKEAKEYRRKNGLRAMKSNTVKAVEAVVNLNAHHSIKDVEKLAERIENEFGFRAIQIAVHRDEGHVTADGRKEKNYHAHIVMCNLKPDGTTIQRTMKPKDMTRLQDITADELRMKRGGKGSKAVRLNHRAYREVARQKEQLAQELEREKLSKEQIKEEFEKFRKENANQGFTSAFFRELTEEKKRQLKEPSMNRKEIREFVESLKESHRGFLGVKKDAVIEELKEKLNRQAIENASLKAIALEAISSVDSEKKRLAEEAERFAEKRDEEYREIVSNEKKRWEKKREELTLQSVLNEVVLMRDEAIKILEKSLKSIEEKYNQVKDSFSKLLSEKLKLEAENETLNKKVKILTEQLETAQKSLETKKTTQSIAPSQKRPEIDARAKAALVKKKQEQDRGFER